MVTKVTGKYGYNVLCDLCGFQYKAFELKKRWDGLMVCEYDWEMRHPADFYKARSDAHQLPYIRPDNDGVDIGPALNTTTSAYASASTPCLGGCSYGLADIGSADCARADVTSL